MRNPVGKICLWLAGSDYSRSELMQFAQWLQQQSPSECVQKIMLLRDQASVASGSVASTEDRRKLPRMDTLSKQVERLLIQEARFSRIEAARLLRGELVKSGNASADLPSLKGGSFSEYVRKLERYATASAILHIATKVRNQAVQSVRSDWPLKR